MVRVIMRQDHVLHVGKVDPQPAQVVQDHVRRGARVVEQAAAIRLHQGGEAPLPVQAAVARHHGVEDGDPQVTNPGGGARRQGPHRTCKGEGEAERQSTQAAAAI